MITECIFMYHMKYYYPDYSKLFLFQKSYIYLKVGRLPISAAIRTAIDLCFEKNILYHYSYHGKTKKKFSNLGLYQIIYGTYLYIYIYLFINSIIFIFV